MLVCEVSNLEEGFMLREDITTRATPWVDESTQLQHTRWDRVLIRKKKNVIFFHFVSMCLYEMVDVEQIYCDNHFMIFISQIIMLFTLNLYPVVCQLHPSKTGRKKNNYNLHSAPESLPDLTISKLIHPFSEIQTFRGAGQLSGYLDSPQLQLFLFYPLT